MLYIYINVSKLKTQRDITIIDKCVSITMPTVRPPQMYQGLGKLHKEDINAPRALCYCGDYEILRSGNRGFHFFEIRLRLFYSILN